jgi:hypothetical protein
MTLKNRGAKSKMKTYGMGVGIKQINYDLNNQLYLLTCNKNHNFARNWYKNSNS